MGILSPELLAEFTEDFSFEPSFIFFGLNDRLVFVAFHRCFPNRFDKRSIIVDAREKDVMGPELLRVFGSAATREITTKSGGYGEIRARLQAFVRIKFRRKQVLENRCAKAMRIF